MLASRNAEVSSFSCLLRSQNRLASSTAVRPSWLSASNVGESCETPASVRRTRLSRSSVSRRLYIVIAAPDRVGSPGPAHPAVPSLFDGISDSSCADAEESSRATASLNPIRAGLSDPPISFEREDSGLDSPRKTMPRAVRPRARSILKDDLQPNSCGSVWSTHRGTPRCMVKLDKV